MSRFDGFNGSPAIRVDLAALNHACLRCAVSMVALLATMVLAAPAAAQGTSSDPILPKDNGRYYLGTFFTGPNCPQLGTNYEPFPTPLTVEDLVTYEVSTANNCGPVALPIFQGTVPEYRNPKFPRQEWEMNVSNFARQPVGPYQPGRRVYATFLVIDPCTFKVKNPGRNVKVRRAGQRTSGPLGRNTTIRTGDSISVPPGQSATLVDGAGSEFQVKGLFTVDPKLNCRPGDQGQPPPLGPRPPPPSGTVKEGSLGVKLRGIRDFVTNTMEAINRALAGGESQQLPRAGARPATHIGGGVPSPHGTERAPVTNSFRVTRSGREQTTTTCAFIGRLSVTSRSPRRSVTVRPGRCAVVERGKAPRVVSRRAAPSS
jgi:hypothetical protein